MKSVTLSCLHPSEDGDIWIEEQKDFLAWLKQKEYELSVTGNGIEIIEKIDLEAKIVEALEYATLGPEEILPLEEKFSLAELAWLKQREHEIAVAGSVGNGTKKELKRNLSLTDIENIEEILIKWTAKLALIEKPIFIGWSVEYDQNVTALFDISDGDIGQLLVSEFGEMRELGVKLEKLIHFNNCS